MRVYHGTSVENYANISENGFQTNENPAWIVSEPNTTYLYSAEYLCRKKNPSKKEFEKAKESAKRDAAKNAVITAALQNSKANRVAVFEFEVDDNDISMDESAIGMDAAVCISSFELNNSYKYSYKVHFFNYEPEQRASYLIDVIDSPLLNKYILNESEIAELKKAANEDFDLESVLYEVSSIDVRE